MKKFGTLLRVALFGSMIGTLLLASLFTSSAQLNTRINTGPTPQTTQQLTTQLPAAPQPTPGKGNVDEGRYKSGVSFREFITRREAMVNMLRGVPVALPGNPRLKALEKLKQQEAALISKATQTNSSSSTSGATRGSASSPFAPLVIPTWTSIGPEPIPDGQTNLIDGQRNPVSGRVLTIDVHPTNPNIAYVGTAQGGLYRTLDGGDSWTQLMDNAATLAVGAVTIDPLDPTTLFVGTGEGNFCQDCFFGVGLYIIKNAESASPILLGPYNSATNTPNGFLANSRSITKILVHPTDDNIIFVGTGSGVGGINAGAGAGLNLSPRGLFRCVNAMSGAPSCTKLDLGGASGGPNVAVRDMVFEPGNPNTMLIGVDDPVNANTNGVWRTTNALSATPSFTRTLTTAAFTNVTLAIHKAGSAVTVYAATEDDANGDTTGVVRKSTDGGLTFPTVLVSSRGFCGGQCWYDMVIAVDPNDVNNVFIGGNGDYSAEETACKVTTDGVKFVKKAAGLHPDTHAIVIAPSNTSIIYHGNDGGIFKSTNDGNTWVSKNTTGFNATQFVSLAHHPTDRNFMIGGTQDNGTPYLRTSGAWKLGDFGDGGYAVIDNNAIDTGASVVAYHTYYNIKAALIGFVRADGASQIDPAGWPTLYGCVAQVAIYQPNGISCADDTLFYAPMEQGPGNPNTLYFGTDKLYRSSDKGVTMPAVSQVFEPNAPPTDGTVPGRVNSPVSAIGISPTDDNVRLVGITTGRVFATTTGAPVLTEVTPPVTPRKFIGRAVIDPNDSSTAYVTLVGYGVPDGQHIWKTTNLDTAPGAPPVTWTAAGTGIPDVPVDVMVVDPQNSNTLYAGTDIGVYTSTDGGTNWAPYGTGLPRVAVFDMHILDAHRILRIATHGRGIWEIPIPGATGSSPPSFDGVASVVDVHDGSGLMLNWLPAVSANPTANIVYDIYRVPHVTHGDSTEDPSFTPDASNYVTTVTGIAYLDTGLTLAQPYYYIVQARDTNGGGLDTNGNGNRLTKWNAPTVFQVNANAPFALETFESTDADSRFTPALTEATTDPDQSVPAFQRITVADLGTTGIGKMYAPDFSPGDELDGCSPDTDPLGTHCGGQSDFYTQIGPFNGSGNPALTATSIMEFDNAINAEAAFDGGVLEIKVGSAFASGDATPFPNNTSIWDLGDYIIEGQYNDVLDGELAGGVIGSPLQGRRAYSGVKASHHVRVTLRNFAPGGLHNPTGQPVYIRFRMTSDAASANGVDAGWFVDNLVINNLSCHVNIAASTSGATAFADSTYTGRNYSPVGAIDGDRTGQNWENGGGWNDNTRDVWPDNWSVVFDGEQTISEVRVYTLQNDFTSPVEPTPLTPADLYGIKDFEVQTCTGPTNNLVCATVPTGGTITGNDKAMRTIVFGPTNASAVRIKINDGREHFSRLVEVEVFGCGAN